MCFSTDCNYEQHCIVVNFKVIVLQGVTWSPGLLLRKQQTGQLSNMAEAAVVDQGGVEMKTDQFLIWILVYYSHKIRTDANYKNTLNAPNNKA